MEEYNFRQLKTDKQTRFSPLNSIIMSTGFQPGFTLETLLLINLHISITLSVMLWTLEKKLELSFVILVRRSTEYGMQDLFTN